MGFECLLCVKKNYMGGTYMKKRKLLQFICVLLICSLLCLTATAANQVQPRYAKIHTLSSELFGFNWLGKATCCGSVSLLDETCTIELHVELQRSTDGVNGWDTIRSWSATGHSEVAIDETCYVAAGYYYRVGTAAIIYDAEGYFIESSSASSAILYR